MHIIILRVLKHHFISMFATPLNRISQFGWCCTEGFINNFIMDRCRPQSVWISEVGGVIISIKEKINAAANSQSGPGLRYLPVLKSKNRCQL